ncbi:MAG: hypothetical protein IJU34_05105 [Bacteroidales bacterium]|nr:hypothetical protein [Bacteroidales bacterium]
MLLRVCIISLNQDPVIPLTEEEAGRILADFHRLRDRKEDLHLKFYQELMDLLATGISRYCTKHLGKSPSAYRRSLQPRK